MGRILSQVQEEQGACPACGLPRLVPWREATASDPRAAHVTYALDRCVACGTAVTRRAPGEDSGLYQGGGYTRPPRVLDGLIEPLRRLGERAQLRALGPLSANSDVFEVGAGDARLLRALEHQGHRVAGTEPYAISTEAAVSRVPVEELELPPHAYDLIFAWHVLEHLDHPFDALARLTPALRRGGRVVVAVPNSGSLQARLGGDAWFHQDVPRHAVHFTRAGLVALVERAGLRVTHLTTASLDQNLLGMTQSMLTRATGRRDLGFATLKQSHPRARDLALSAAGLLALAPAAAVAEAYAVARGAGGSLIVQAVPTP